MSFIKRPMEEVYYYKENDITIGNNIKSAYNYIYRPIEFL